MTDYKTTLAEHFSSIKNSSKIFYIKCYSVFTTLNKTEGTYEVIFNSTDLSTGIYFYRIAIHSDGFQAGNFIETKKMILIK